MATAKRDLARATIKEHPALSNRAIAKLIGISHRTVAAARDDEVPQLIRREATGRKARGRQPQQKTAEEKLPVVYRCYGKPHRGYAQLLYVGCSLAFLNRLVRHSKEIPWCGEVTTIRLQHYLTVQAAVAAAERAIRHERRPRYNKVVPLPPLARVTKVRKKRQLVRKTPAVTAASRPTGLDRRLSRYPNSEDIEALKAAARRQAEEQGAAVDMPSKKRIRRPRSHSAGNER